MIMRLGFRQEQNSRLFAYFGGSRSRAMKLGEASFTGGFGGKGTTKAAGKFPGNGPYPVARS